MKRFYLALPSILLLLAACTDKPTKQSAEMPTTYNEDSKTDTEDSNTDEHNITSQNGINYTDIAGTMVYYKSVRDEFYDFPFPADHRRTADGHVDIRDFPNVSSIVAAYTDLIATEVTGFSNNGAAYFHFTGALDTSSLPTPDQSQEPTSTIKLLNIDKDSAAYGQQIPVKLNFFSHGTEYYPDNTLAIMPYPGFPLDPSTTYAIVILRQLGDARGKDLGSPALLQAALNNEDFSRESLQEVVTAMAPLADYLADSKTIKVEEIAAATVFTTQDPRAELLAIHNYINTHEVPKIIEYKYLYKKSNYYVVDAYYYGWNFQQGKKPYLAEGGGFAFDKNGTPLIADNHELMMVRFTVPNDSSKMPEKGWPLVMIAHGTGGDYEWFEGDGYLSRSRLLAEYGMAAIGISQPLHYERGCEKATPDMNIEKDCALDDTQLNLAAFNVLNPASGRTSFRQSAADTFLLTQMLIKNPPVIPASDTPDNKEVKFDTSTLMFHGHSHGGISGAIAMGIEHRVRASVHSGAGGLLIGTVAHSPVYNALAKTFMYLEEGEELTIMHPAMMIVQTAADVTDPINYGPYYLKKAKANEGHHILYTIGKYDGDTPYQTNDYLTAAAGLPIVGPQRWEVTARSLMKMEPEAGTAKLNCTAADGTKYTCGIRQYSDEDDSNQCQYTSDLLLQDYCGHFVVFDKDDAAHMYAEFLYTYLHENAPSINPEWETAIEH